MTMRELLLALAAVAVAVAPLGAAVALEPGVEPGVRPHAEEPVPQATHEPLFCTGVGSVSVCVPPW